MRRPHREGSGWGLIGVIALQPIEAQLSGDIDQVRLIDLMYQPIISLTAGAQVGQEGFARMRMPDGTPLKAARFMPALQQMHRAHWVDEKVIPLVLEDCLQGRLQGDCFINLSADLLRRPTLMHALLDDFLQRTAHSPQDQLLGRIVLELDFRAQQLDLDAACTALQPWLAAGARL
ncbi:EAL domain-containing protein, partial [Thiomonas arsenitoxydans]|uniref:EAL domain-containing protein n=1 Tax=Thiomonas arsenitoxydans (strain DSM 22701 / CIP 110005 / 3As) TaxID=426114 RepID=UPI001ACE07C2